ncbi:VWA domain-containing protein [Neisseria zoodegmatis]|nr:VWA domain-containing protein [Neisseria zoodegmatis]
MENLAVNDEVIVEGTSQDDVLHGNSGKTIIYGKGGNDTIYSHSGLDLIYGGEGDDIYHLQGNGGTIIEESDEGNDSVHVGITYTAPNYVENITLTGNGNINGFGNNSDNILTGNGGNNRLSTGRGNDILDGREGNDLLLAGDGDDRLNGGEGNDILRGGNGNDQLDGGSGNDVLEGGAGNDVYHVDNVNDIVFEAADEGNDTVYSSVTHTAATHVENLTLTGNGNINGFGNNADNILIGNSGNNRLSTGRGNDILDGREGNDLLLAGDGDDRLNGGEGNDILRGGNGNDQLDGGSGNDVLEGGAGNDVYHVDNVNDTVFEAADEGNDTVYSSVTHTAATHVENLTLTGNGNINGFGNNADNILIGNSGNNRLSAGRGNDILDGREGNDLLLAGDGDDRLNGGEGNDILRGGNGKDYLDGGTGNDTLEGGEGNDTYYFDKGYGHDVVSDSSDNNIVRFGENIKTDDLIISESHTNWVITIKETGDTLTIQNQAAGSVAQFEFSDGLSYSAADLLKAVNGTTVPQPEPEEGLTLVGDDNDNVLNGGDKNDVLQGLKGNDTLRGGAGADKAEGGMGDDKFIAVGNATSGIQTDNKAYDDVLGSAASNLNGKDWAEVVNGDVFDGGEGNDTLYVFGTTDLSVAALQSIEKVDMPSDVTFAASQLDKLEINGDGVGVLRIKGQSAPATVVFDAGQLSGVKQIDIGENITVKVKNIDGLNGVEIISGTGSLIFDEPSKLTTEHSITSSVKVLNPDNSSASGSAEVLDNIVSATESNAETKNVQELDYRELLADNVKKDGATVITLKGSQGNDYISGGNSGDELNGADGNDVLVGRNGNDIFVIEGTGKKTVIDGGSGQDTDTIVLSNAKQGAEIDLSKFEGRIGDDTLIQIGAGSSGGVAGGAGNKTNLMLIIDTSGSMLGINMQNAQKAAIELIEKYSQTGGTAIRIIGFSSFGYVQFNGMDTWMNKEEAIKAINTLSANGGTDYYSALDTAETAFTTNRGSVFNEKGQNFSMFLSDGEPNTYLDMTRQEQWENFAIKHQIVSHAIGFGGIHSKNALEPIAFDGTKVADTSANHAPGQIEPILEGDIDKLSTTVSSTAKTDFIENVAGTAHDDKITGNSLNNDIRSGAGNDTLNGLGGNDHLHGGAGNDTYHFGKNYGHDVIYDNQGSNTVVFKGVLQNEVSVEAVQKADGTQDWVISLNGGADTLTIAGQSDNAQAAVTTFVFDDGQVDNSALAKLIGNSSANADSEDAIPVAMPDLGETTVSENSAAAIEIHSGNLPTAEGNANTISDGLLDNSNTLDSALDSLLPTSAANAGTGMAETAFYPATETVLYTEDNASNTAFV